MLGLRFCARAFSSCGERGPLFITVRGPLTVAASLVAEHRLQTRRLSSCGSRAQLLRGMWDLPRPGLEPVSPALAGRFSTTAPPGKPLSLPSLYSSDVKNSAWCTLCLHCRAEWGWGKTHHRVDGFMPNSWPLTPVMPQGCPPIFLYLSSPFTLSNLGRPFHTSLSSSCKAPSPSNFTEKIEAALRKLQHALPPQ